MAQKKLNLHSALSSGMIAEDTQSNSGAYDDVDGGVITAIHSIEIDNSGASSTKVYTKIYDHGSPTIGTTLPGIILPTEAGKKATWTILEGVAEGTTTGLSFATVQEAGTGGTTNPAANVTVRVVYVG